VTVGARKLVDILRALPDGAEVTLQQQDKRLLVKAGKSRFVLQTLPAEDFPRLAKPAGEAARFALPQKALGRVLGLVQYAMAQQDIRYYLNGLLMVVEDKSLKLVATDGHRLAYAALELDVKLPRQEVIVPRKTVLELAKLVEDADGEVRVELSPSKIRVSTRRIVLTSKLIDGTFPDYERVIPQGNDKRMEVDNAAFAQAVDRVSTLSSDKGRAVKLTISGGKLTLSVNNPDSGTATEELPVEYGFDPLEIGFNARYLLDIAGQLESGTAEFQLADPGSPTMVRDGKDLSALYVLMPMRV
jgi:DNA polymerase-3 subunit beta